MKYGQVTSPSLHSIKYFETLIFLTQLGVSRNIDCSVAQGSARKTQVYCPGIHLIFPDDITCYLIF